MTHIVIGMPENEHTGNIYLNTQIKSYFPLLLFRVMAFQILVTPISSSLTRFICIVFYLLHKTDIID